MLLDFPTVCTDGGFQITGRPGSQSVPKGHLGHLPGNRQIDAGHFIHHSLVTKNPISFVKKWGFHNLAIFAPPRFERRKLV